MITEEVLTKSILQKFQKYYDRLNNKDKYELNNNFRDYCSKMNDSKLQNCLENIISHSNKWDTLYSYYDSENCKSLINLIKNLLKC